MILYFRYYNYTTCIIQYIYIYKYIFIGIEGVEFIHYYFSTV